MAITGGTITGSGDISVTSLTTWQAGTIEGASSSIAFHANGGMDLTNNNQKRLMQRTLNFQGTLDWQDGDLAILDSVINIPADDTF